MSGIDYTRIELLVLDVDGVLTDGRIVLTPSGEEIKAYHVRDGAGLKYWKRAGGRLAFLTGRGSPAVLRRAEELGVDAVRMDAKDKFPAYRQILAEMGLGTDQAAAMGDDLTDLPILRHCAFSAAPCDAVEEVRSAVHYVAALAGGCGCVREVVELLLKRAGKWQHILDRYRPQEDRQA